MSSQLQVQHGDVPSGVSTETSSTSVHLDSIKVPRPEDVPWPWMAAPPSFPSSPSSSFSSLSDQDLDIWLGPSTTLPGKLGSRDDTLSRMSRDDILSLANCRSTKRCVRLSDFMRLNSLPAKDGQQLQLSFGSALHVGDGTNVLCKVCSRLFANELACRQRSVSAVTEVQQVIIRR